MDYRIFNVHIDVNACDCTRECRATVRKSALKVDSGRNGIDTLENQTCVGNMPV